MNNWIKVENELKLVNVATRSVVWIKGSSIVVDDNFDTNSRIFLYTGKEVESVFFSLAIKLGARVLKYRSKEEETVSFWQKVFSKQKKT